MNTSLEADRIPELSAVVAAALDAARRVHEIAAPAVADDVAVTAAHLVALDARISTPERPFTDASE